MTKPLFGWTPVELVNRIEEIFNILAYSKQEHLLQEASLELLHKELISRTVVCSVCSCCLSWNEISWVWVEPNVLVPQYCKLSDSGLHKPIDKPIVVRVLKNRDLK